ncbi:hypothetical protein Sliba_71590 [Streptomyces nigrescens]|uniref:Uncharacterized protein n=1 Tax=Streptomyces nigrescens TaxID=1920 RepID=A0A640TXK5_STRNI|nr:hypothetical protein Sliba_71590 [Streptomyces libani subsp. libani]
MSRCANCLVGAARTIAVTHSAGAGGREMSTASRVGSLYVFQEWQLTPYSLAFYLNVVTSGTVLGAQPADTPEEVDWRTSRQWS